MKIGDIRVDKPKDYEKYIWSACIDCGKERWVRVRKGRPEYISCRNCSVKRSYDEKTTLYPIISLKSSYVKEYGKTLENHLDLAEHKIYEYRIFCMDCPDFEACKGILWKSCPNRVETIKEMR